MSTKEQSQPNTSFSKLIEELPWYFKMMGAIDVGILSNALIWSESNPENAMCLGIVGGAIYILERSVVNLARDVRMLTRYYTNNKNY